VQVTRLAATLAADGADLIDLGQAIVGLLPPAAALDAARGYLLTPHPHAYSPDPGLPALRDALAHMLRAEKSIQHARAEGVMVTCGANQAFANVLLTVTEPGDEVLTFSPGYFDHGYAIQLAGCTEREVPLRVQDQRFCFDLRAVQGALSPRTRCVVLVSPGNPTGAVAPPAFVRDLCELCRARGVWLLSDETYDRLTFPPVAHTSPAKVSDYDRIAVIGTFSKLLGMAGWRVGYFHVAPEVAEEAYKVQDALVVCAPVVSQHAVLGALPHLGSFVVHARDELLRRREALEQALGLTPHLELLRPDGATFGLARIRGTDDDVAFCKHLLQSTGLVTVPGSAFGSQGKGYVRLSFGNQPVERIAQAGVRLEGLRWPAP
jgi:aminotransferase